MKRVHSVRSGQVPARTLGAVLISSSGSAWIPPGYHSIMSCPEVAGAVWAISDMLGSMSIQLMENQSNGDVRIMDELARKVDISPWRLGNRQAWISWIAQAMVTNGNAFVLPVTENGLLADLPPMPGACTVPDPVDGYGVSWCGHVYNHDEVLHFVYHPDPLAPYRGLGTRAQLRQVVDSLAQESVTKNAYMSSEYKPPLIIGVNSDADLSDEAKREEFVKRYLHRENPEEPLVLPSDLIKVLQAKPLSLNDLAIRDGIELDKKSVSAILGVPAFMVGAGSFNKDEYNTFIRKVLLPLAKIIEQELTKKLLLSSKRYFRFNSWGLYAYDLKEMAGIGDDQYVRGLMTGNEVRHWLGLSPKKGLDELVILENYIPADRIGDQKKLKGGTDNDSK